MGIMQWLTIILFGLLFGVVVSHFAKNRGRSAFGWFFIGFLFGVIGLVLIFLLPKVEKHAAQPGQKSTLPKRSEAWLKMWYYLDPMHIQQGPFDFPDLIKKWREKGITEKSYIWGEGMAGWKRLADLPELIREIEQA